MCDPLFLCCCKRVRLYSRALRELQVVLALTNQGGLTSWSNQMKSDLEELYKYSLLPVLPDPGDDPRTWFSFIKENQLSFANGIDEHTQMMDI